jgi:hypothetical protein
MFENLWLGASKLQALNLAIIKMYSRIAIIKMRVPTAAAAAALAFSPLAIPFL